MAFDIYISYLIAATVIIIIPGPTVIVIASHAMQYGIKQASKTILGIVTSHTLFFVITALGITVIFANNSKTIELIKWGGSIYLIYQGIKNCFLSIKKSNLDEEKNKMIISSKSSSLFLQGFIVNTSNPKALAFYIAFFPPFINQSQSIGIQLIIMGTTFITILVITSFMYAYFAFKISSLFQKNNYELKLKIITGVFLIITGIYFIFNI